MYFRCIVETGSGEIKNAATTSYKAYDVDIETGNFVELTKKPTDETTVDITKYTIPINYHSTCQSDNDTWGRNGILISDVVQVDENIFILAIVQQLIRYSTPVSYEYNYVYFKKVILNSNGTITTYDTASQYQCGQIGCFVNGAVTYSYDYISTYAYNNNYFYYDGTASTLNKTMYIMRCRVTTNNSTTSSINATNKTGSVSSSMQLMPTDNCLRWDYYNIHPVYNDCVMLTYCNYNGNTSTEEYAVGMIMLYAHSSSSMVAQHKTYSTTATVERVLEYNPSNKYVYISGFFGTSSVVSGWYSYSNLSFTLKTPQENHYEIRNGYYGSFNSNTKLFSIYEDSSGATIKNQFTLAEVPEGGYMNYQQYSFSINSDNILSIYVRKYDSGLYPDRVQFYQLDLEKNTATFVGEYVPTGSRYSYDNLDIGKNLVFWDKRNKQFFKSSITVVLEDVIKPAENKIDGVTKSKCTSSTAGQVYVLNK